MNSSEENILLDQEKENFNFHDVEMQKAQEMAIDVVVERSKEMVMIQELSRQNNLLQSQLDDIFSKYQEKEAEIQYLQRELESSVTEKITLKNQISELENGYDMKLREIQRLHEHEPKDQDHKNNTTHSENKDENEIFNRIKKLNSYIMKALKTEPSHCTNTDTVE